MILDPRRTRGAVLEAFVVKEGFMSHMRLPMAQFAKKKGPVAWHPVVGVPSGPRVAALSDASAAEYRTGSVGVAEHANLQRSQLFGAGPGG